MTPHSLNVRSQPGAKRRRKTKQPVAPAVSASGFDPLAELAAAAAAAPFALDPISASGFGNDPLLQPTMASATPLSAVPAQPLKIVAVFPNLLRGGAEQWLLYLARFLDPRRAVLTRCIVTNARNSDPDFTAEIPAPVEMQRRDSLRRAVRDCDVLIVFGLPCDKLLGDLRAKLCIFIAHGEGGWTKGLLGQSRQACDHVVAVSRRVAQAVCDGFPTTVIYNGVDAARLAQSRSRDEVRRQFGFTDGDFVLGYVGRYSPEKRPELLIRAVAQLPAEFKLLLVGWGADRPRLMELANELIPGRYAMTTAARYLGDYYRAMDAFGLVSNQEGFSMALLEAMMCELPVVVTPVGSVPEMIEDRVSGVVVSGAPESIAAGVERLARYPEWARGVAAEGHRFAARHGHASRMSREYEALFQRLWTAKFGCPA
jgi:glycosyltransferase involved in cell wall biosynthesis